MTDHEIVETIKAIAKALKAEQDLAATYRSAWTSQKDMCDQLSTDVTRLENERDRLKEQLDKAEYIEDGGARNAH